MTTHHRVQMRDGTEAILRPVTSGDVDAMVDLQREIIRAGSGVVHTLDHWDPTRAAQHITTWCSLPETDGRQWVAEYDGQVVGSADIRRLGPALVRHVGISTLGIHPDRQGIGLGRHLMRSVLSWAMAARLARLELYVRADNAPALALYSSLGFIEEARRRQFVRLPDGQFVDDVMMAILWSPNPEHQS